MSKKPDYFEANWHILYSLDGKRIFLNNLQQRNVLQFILCKESCKLQPVLQQSCKQMQPCCVPKHITIVRLFNPDCNIYSNKS